MGVYEELIERGLIAQVTDEKGSQRDGQRRQGNLLYWLRSYRRTVSMSGHFMALCLMKRLQMAGNKPIALVGGGTGMIGDPSGRTDMRQMMTKETIAHNCDCFRHQMERFIHFGDGKMMPSWSITVTGSWTSTI